MLVTKVYMFTRLHEFDIRDSNPLDKYRFYFSTLVDYVSS